MPLLAKIQSVYRVTRKLRPAIRYAERYKSSHVPPKIYNDQKGTSGNTSEAQESELSGSNSRIHSKVKVEEPENGIVMNLDLQYSFKELPAMNMTPKEALKNEAIEEMPADDLFDVSSSGGTIPMKKADAARLLVVPSPSVHNSSEAEFGQLCSGTAPLVTKQNPIPLGDTVRTIVGNIVGNAFSTLLQNVHGVSTAATAMGRTQQELTSTFREMPRREMSSTRKDGGTDRPNNRNNKKPTNLDDLQKDILGSASVPPKRVTNKRRRVRTASNTGGGSEDSSTVGVGSCKKMNAPCKKGKDDDGRNNVICDGGDNVSGMMAHSGSVMQSEKYSIPEPREEKINTSKYSQQIQRHANSSKEEPALKILQEFERENFALTNVHLSPTSKKLTPKKHRPAPGDIPPFYHILPKYREHYANKLKKMRDDTLQKNSGSRSEPNIARTCSTNYSTTTSPSGGNSSKNTTTTTTTISSPPKRPENLKDTLEKPDLALQKSKSYSAIATFYHILGTPYNSSKRSDQTSNPGGLSKGGRIGEADSIHFDCSTLLMDVKNPSKSPLKSENLTKRDMTSKSGPRCDKPGNGKGNSSGNCDTKPGKGESKAESNTKKQTYQPQIKGCGGVKLESGETTIDCGVIKAAKKGESQKESEKEPSTAIDCSKYKTQQTSSGGGSDTKKDSPGTIDCSKYMKQSDSVATPTKLDAKKDQPGVIDCSKYKSQTASTSSAGKAEKTGAIDCSKYESKAQPTSDQSQTKKDQSSAIDCSKYKTQQTSSTTAGKTEAKKEQSNVIDCSKYNIEKTGPTAKSEAKKEQSSTIDCSKYKTQQTSSSPAKSEKSDPKKDQSKSGGIDCSKYTVEKPSAPKTQTTSAPGKTDTKSGQSSAIDCSKYKAQQTTSTAGRSDKPDSKKEKPTIDCSKYDIEKGTTAGKSGEAKKEATGTIDCSKFKTQQTSSSAKKSDTPEAKKDQPSVIDCSKYKAQQTSSTTGKSDKPDATKEKSNVVDCSKYDIEKGKSGESKKEQSSGIDCSKYKVQQTSSTTGKFEKADTKKEQTSAIDCSKYKAQQTTSTAGKSDKPDAKKDQPSVIDCSKYKTQQTTSTAGKPDKPDAKTSAVVDCSKYNIEKKDTSAKSGEAKKEQSSAIDCSKYKTQQTSSTAAKADKPDAKKDQSKSGAIDCSKYNVEKSTMPKTQPTSMPGKAEAKKDQSSTIDCSKLKTQQPSTAAKPDKPDAKTEKSSTIDCSKYNIEKAGTAAKSGETRKDQSSTIDCSKLKTQQTSSTEAKKPDAKKEASNVIDCSKYDIEKGGTAAKSGEAKKEQSSAIDCSKYKAQQVSSTATKSDKPDAKKDQSSTIDCSKLSAQPTAGASAKPDAKKETAIDCSKYNVEKSSSVAKSSETKKEQSSTIDCSKYKVQQTSSTSTKSDKSDAKKDQPSPIDCSKYKAQQVSSTTGKSDKPDAKKDQPSTVDCSKYQIQQTSNTAAKSDKPDGKKEKIDCSKFDIEKGGSAAKSADAKKSTAVDCSKSQLQQAGSTTAGKSPDAKKESPATIDCSKYKTQQSGSTKSPEPSAKKDQSSGTIDCSKYKGQGDTKSVKKDESGKKGPPSSTGSQAGGHIDCSKYKTQDSSSKPASAKQPTTGPCETKTNKLCGEGAAPKTPNESQLPKGGACNTQNNQKNTKPSSEGKTKKISAESPSADSKLSSKQKTDFSKARDSKSAGISNESASKIPTSAAASPGKGIDKKKANASPVPKPCPPVVCQREPTAKADPAKRIKLEKKKELFNCCLKVVGQQKVDINNCPMPALGDDHVVIKMHTVGLCGSDVYMFDKGIDQIDGCPISLGHEGSGIVIETGRLVAHLKKGDSVAIEPGISCGQCKYCRLGRYNICPHMRFNGLLSTYCAHPAHFCHKVPSRVRLEEAALAHPLALGLHACHRGCVSIGSRVLVLGACPLGLSIVMAARSMGADTITIIDTIEKNLKVATDLCADKTILAKNSMSVGDLTEMVLSEMKCRPNVVIDCCGCAKTINMSISALEQGGHFVLAGCQAECGNMPILTALAKEICFCTSFRSANMFGKSLSLIESGRAMVSRIVTHCTEFCDAQDAFQFALNETESGAIKVLVIWPRNEEGSKN